jgi:hypothetical protein
MQTNSTEIARLLKKVYLGGIITEAVVDFGANTIQAVDPSSALFIKVTEPPSEDGVGRVGIGNLSTVIKHLDVINGETSIMKNGNRLVIGASGRGEIKYLITAEEFISSAVAEDNIDALLEPCVVQLELTQQNCSDFSTYMSLVKNKSTTFIYDPTDSTVRVDAGLESENQFTIPFGKAECYNKVPAFSVTVYSQHLDQIFGVLEWGKEPPLILMAPEHPLIVAQDENNIWACLPLANTGGEMSGE